MGHRMDNGKYFMLILLWLSVYITRLVEFFPRMVQVLKNFFWILLIPTKVNYSPYLSFPYWLRGGYFFHLISFHFILSKFTKHVFKFTREQHFRLWFPWNIILWNIIIWIETNTTYKSHAVLICSVN